MRCLSSIRVAVILCLAIHCSDPGFAQSELSSRIDDILQGEMQRRKIPGLSLLVLKDGEIVEERHLGFADLELRSPVTEHSVFSIASMSKIYTAAAVLLLAQRGELDLDTGIREFLPDAPETWNAITLRQLITHTSGLVDDWGLNDDWENTSTSLFATARSNRDFLDRLYATPLAFEPGTSLRYACGTFVLGVVIEKTTGTPYAQFMQEQLFSPLGLTETWVDNPEQLIPGRVSGYVFEDEKLINGYQLSSTTLARGDVGIRTSARDIAKWLMAMKAGSLLSTQTLAWSGRHATLTDGSLVSRSQSAWSVWPMRGKTSVAHGGNYRSGFSSQMVEFPESKLTIILLTNLADVPNFPTVQRIAALYDPDFRFIRDLPTAEALSSAPTRKLFRLIKAIGDNTSHRRLVSKRFPIAFYGPGFQSKFRAVTSLDYLSHRDVIDQGIELFGEPVHELWFYRLNGERTRHTVFWLNADGKVLFIEYPES